MIRFPLPALLLFALPAAAQDCVVTGGPDSCAPILACVGEDGRWFHGAAIGWETGTIRGAMDDGPTCEGDWSFEPGTASGEASLSCTDGTDIEMTFESLDGETGTSVARGETGDGAPVIAFTGPRVRDYMMAEMGADGPEDICGMREVPASALR